MELKTDKESIKTYVKNNLSSTTKLNEINASDILNTTVKNMQGKDVYLSSFMEAVPVATSPEIFHYNRDNSLKITAEVEEDIDLIMTVNKIKELFTEQNDSDTKLVFGGTFEQQQNSFGETGLAFLAGVLLIFGILIFLFNSYRLPFIIESVIPLAFIGVVLGL